MSSRAKIIYAFRSRLLELKPYFFFPANLWRHKNHRVLFEAFRRFKDQEEFANYKLILSGHFDLEQWAKLTNENDVRDVHHLGYVSKAELVLLYSHARALVFVSLFEGFGMPVLEAFGLGCPVICSNTTSLPEIGSDAALLCDPTNPDAVAEAMRTVVTDRELTKSLAIRGQERFAAYSWSQAGGELKQAIIRVASRLQTLPHFSSPAAANTSLPVPAGPLVSIITPSFNQAQFLPRTIESVLSQSYRNIEYIVVDGGSTDGSLEILQSYGDQLKWISEPDNGQTHAINKGLARASGDILSYLNSDDTLAPNAVETVVNALDKSPESGTVYGNANYIDVDDKVTGWYATDKATFEKILQDCCICQPTVYWRASVMKSVGRFDESLHYAMDYEMWLRMAKAGIQMKRVPETIANSASLSPEQNAVSPSQNIQ